MSKYFALRGKVSLGLRDASGNPLAMVSIGNCPDLQLKLSVGTEKHIESMTGYDQTDDIDISSREGSVSMTAEELIKEVVAYALNAKVTTVATGNKTGIALCTDPTDGATYLLPDVNVSSVTLNAGGSAVDQAKFTVDEAYGEITFAADAGVTGAVTASYSTGAATHYAMFGAVLPEVWLRVDGVNKKTMAKCVMDLYRLKLSPTETFLWMNGKGSFVLPGEVLADLTKDVDGAMGQFGRYIEIG